MLSLSEILEETARFVTPTLNPTYNKVSRNVKVGEEQQPQQGRIDK